MQNELKLTGHPDVDVIGQINFEGDITPRSWYKHICSYHPGRQKKKCDRLAVDILSDIVYWYRPYQRRDEITGEVVGWKKKFSNTLLQRSLDAFAEALNETPRCIRESLKVLESLGLIEVQLKSVKTTYGTLPNVMFIKVFPENIAAITYRIKSEEEPETIENSLLTKWVTSKDEIVDKALRNRNQAITKSCAKDDEIDRSSIYRDFTDINSRDFPHTSQQQHNATLDAAAAEREGGGNEFEENQEVDTPHIVNSQEFVANGKSNQVDKKSVPAPRERLSLSEKQEYLKLVSIRSNATLNKVLSSKSLDEVVMALGFLLEKEDEIERSGKEPIHNRAGFFKRALEDDSALDWLQMMEYTSEQASLWRWATEARIRGIFALFDVGSNAAWIKNRLSNTRYNIDVCKEVCEKYGWEELHKALMKHDRTEFEKQQQPA